MIQSLTTNWSFWLLWLAAFLGFPISGLVTNLIVGPVNDPVRGLIAGALTGAVIGITQWLVLRSRLPLPVWWILATAIGAAIGMALGVAFFGTETSGTPLLIRALITGLAIGIAQYVLLRPVLPEAILWIPVIALAWTIGWFITGSAGINLDYNWSVFGASGAITFQPLTAIALFWLVRHAPA